MSNQWLRLWHDMPNDPKWRTIARISGQRIGDVQAVYMHLLTSASQHVTRGHADVTAEDLASAIDVTDDAIESILDAMQGRVLEGMRLTGWEKRQPKREDSGNEESGAKSSAERKRLQREREKAAQENATGNQCHGASRNVTTDTDTDTEQKIPSLSKPSVIDCPHEKILDAYAENLPDLAQPIRSLWRDGKNAPALKARWAWLMTACHEKGKRKGERMATTEAEGVEWFCRFFDYVSHSDFLTGRQTEWSCDLIWLVNKSNFEKVIQGSYENQKAAA